MTMLTDDESYENCPVCKKLTIQCSTTVFKCEKGHFWASDICQANLICHICESTMTKRYNNILKLCI